MKTATVTWITYNNYGTLLQAYALQQQLRLEGIDNIILSDEKILEAHKSKRSKTDDGSSTDEFITTQNRIDRLKNLFANPKRMTRIILARSNRKEYEKPYLESQTKCELFKDEEMKILHDVEPENLITLNEKFDVFICGSDQVWSVFEQNFNPYYYLDFVAKKKIAYAPSFGTSIIPKQTAEKIKKMLSDFSGISVREKKSADQLSVLTDRKVEWVADPTLLHDERFWTEFAEEVPTRKKRYLLCYFLENREWYFDYAKKLSRRLHLEIVLIPNRWDYISSEYVVKTGVGPKEFVSLIQHAEYVLTDSYHGSIFSLIFEQDFQYLLRFEETDPKSQNIRIQSLFDYLDLNSRIVTCQGSATPTIHVENYDAINRKLEALRVYSRNYLEDCLR